MISDVIQLIRDLASINADDGDKKSIGSTIGKLFSPDTRGESIKKRARDSVMQFPVLVSDNISREALLLIRRALEFEYAAMLRIAISASNLAELDGPESKRKFLRRFHNNVRSTGLFESLTDPVQFEIINKENLAIFEEDLKKESLNDLTIKNVGRLSETEAKHIIKESNHSVNITSSDIKKANDMMPTVLEIQIEMGDKMKTTSIVVGVQCIAHLIPTDEMMYFIGRSVKEDSLIFRAIQWTTGEIRFFKDFLFSIDRIKAEARSVKSQSSKWWRRLRGMASSNRIRSFFNMHKFIPNATIVMSMNEVETLKNTQGVDLFNSDTVRSIMRNFFLLGFVIIDDIDEITYIFDEETGDYRNYSFSALKRETSSRSDVDLKSLISLVGSR